MDASPDDIVRHRAERQYGVFGQDQAVKAGFTRAAIRHRLAIRRWIETDARRVFAFPGAPRTWRQRLMTATLCGGPATVVSHVAAAALHQLPGFETTAVDVSCPNRPRALSRIAAVHDSGRWSARDRMTLASIPVTSVARTLVDVAAATNPKQMERALDHCLVNRTTTLYAVAAAAERLQHRGCAGSATLRRVLTDRLATPPLESELEQQFWELLIAHGLPLPERQIALGGDEFVARVDFLYREQRIIIEIDSFAFHASHADLKRDQLRKARLAAAGFRVIPIGWAMMRDDPGLVAAIIREALHEG